MFYYWEDDHPIKPAKPFELHVFTTKGYDCVFRREQGSISWRDVLIEKRKEGLSWGFVFMGSSSRLLGILLPSILRVDGVLVLFLYYFFLHCLFFHLLLYPWESTTHGLSLKQLNCRAELAEVQGFPFVRSRLLFGCSPIKLVKLVKVTLSGNSKTKLPPKKRKIHPKMRFGAQMRLPRTPSCPLPPLAEWFIKACQSHCCK